MGEKNSGIIMNSHGADLKLILSRRGKVARYLAIYCTNFGYDQSRRLRPSAAVKLEMKRNVYKHNPLVIKSQIVRVLANRPCSCLPELLPSHNTEIRWLLSLPRRQLCLCNNRKLFSGSDSLCWGDQLLLLLLPPRSCGEGGREARTAHPWNHGTVPPLPLAVLHGRRGTVWSNLTSNHDHSRAFILYTHSTLIDSHR